MKWAESEQERELIALAREIARERGVRWDVALAAARQQLAGLEHVARRWDLASLLRRPKEPPTA